VRPLFARRSDVWGFLLLGLCALGSLAASHAAAARRERAAEREARAALVRRLDLTDLCLFPEARYTRHPSQADLFAPFQDHPTALEHFPSGSVVPPPRRAE
jgi:hypothetical protein